MPRLFKVAVGPETALATQTTARAPLPWPPCFTSPRIHPGVVFAAVGSLGLVTTDSSQGQRSWSAVGPKAAVETTLTRLAAMSPYATFVRWTVSSSCQIEIPAELIRLASGHVPVSIREAVGRVEDDAAREGSLQTSSAARYGRNEVLAIIFVLSVIQVGFVPAALAGNVPAKWQTA